MEHDKPLRKIVIKNGYPKSGKIGYFHGWHTEPFFNEAQPYLTKTFALIEFEGGEVEFIDPPLIKFTTKFEAIK